MTTEVEFLANWISEFANYISDSLQSINDRLAALSISVSSFSPTSGYSGSGVTITGTGFGASQGSSTVTMGSGVMAVSSWSDTQIVADVVDGVSIGDQLTISVTTSGGTSDAPGVFTITAPPPAILSFTPASGPDGTHITITGRGFGSAGSVSLGNGTMDTYGWDDTQIIAAVPGYSPGSYQISVSVQGVGTLNSATEFEVTS